ncbi:MAG: 1,4-beta cellobiohydrolase [Thermoleophilia bacterium]|nr:1,4-beta cellobiohydrolase [Thermoleophilia bacterium]MCZ4496938.1 1,4-beta cellobiohydrolase [Thermoleophilia bacterium]
MTYRADAVLACTLVLLLSYLPAAGIDWFNFGATTTAPPPPGNPLAGATMWIDESANPARAQATAWRTSRPTDAAQMDKIADQPKATWLGSWSGDIQAAVADRMRAAGTKVAVFVAYNIPLRDCSGHHSAGGISDPASYRSWIQGLADGIGTGTAVVILEPDALADMDCLSVTDKSTRTSLLKEAVATLKARRGAIVYLDAGNSSWVTASTMARRLTAAGIAQSDGFALNISNYSDTARETTYGRAISQGIGRKHFLIDTSRNGVGGNGEWCNAAGRALGARPTTQTGEGLVDAYLWIKSPGESDGTCNGGPAAGQWWADYALGLAQHAAW